MPSIAATPIEAHREEIARPCVQARVRRLDAFGSVVRADFSSERSDVDFLVEFDALPPGELADAYFSLEENLEALLGRPVDLLTERSLRNPWLRRRVEAERVPVYAS
jgi:predicted nucleotidyltransferase